MALKPAYKMIIIFGILFIAPVSIANAIKCPPSCKCSWVLDSLEVDCSGRGLLEYPNFDDLPIERLDLSNNYFAEFPKELADVTSLIYLDLSNNKIEYLDANALIGFFTLRILLMANNSITSWDSISPSKTFRNAISLKRLSLSGNKLDKFTNSDPSSVLVSQSLTQLELERCAIRVASGDQLMTGLPNLEHLVLSGNTLTSISNLPSKSLRSLELSNCDLQVVTSDLLYGLPSLEALNLSWNGALKFGNNADDLIVAPLLTELDMSFCNIDDINLSGLPSLTSAHLRGNMLRGIGPNLFANNTQLEIIDLSRNSLRLIDGEAFSRLKRLSKLDISYNEIARLDRNLFRSNDVLISLNLSRNVIEKFTKLVSNSLRDINLSWCEIISIDGASFSGLQNLEQLDLSNNILKAFPGGMRSETLKTLYLSNCRLSAIQNNTFRDFPELASLHLNGNRFTNPFPTGIFSSNKFLDEIWIGDNPWICNCNDAIFIGFFEYLTEKPQKLKDKNSVRCASPSYYYGKTWEAACAGIWLPNGRSGNAEKVWTTILLSIGIIGVVVFLFTCFQKYMRSRKQRNDSHEYRRNLDEMNEIRRQNQRMLEEDGRPNAPGSFETNLPSYEDAIRMPKLERPIKSMVDLTASARTRRKLQRSRTDPEAPNDDDLLVDNHQRFRSEEMLANRDKERTAYIDPFRRTGDIEHNPSGSRRFSIEDSRFPAAHFKSQNLQSAEQIGNFQGYDHSPYTKRKPKIAEIPPFKRATLHAESVEFLTDPEFDASSKPGSPFARRKPKTPQSPGSPLTPAIEDYFGSTQKSHSSSSNGSDFQVVVEPEVCSLPDGNDSSSASNAELNLERGKRKKRKNSTSRRASGNFSAAAAAAAADGETSSSDREPIVIVHKPMRETLF